MSKGKMKGCHRFQKVHGGFKGYCALICEEGRDHMYCDRAQWRVLKLSGDTECHPYHITVYRTNAPFLLSPIAYTH